MKKVLFWMSFSLLLSLPLMAQDSARSEFFGGFQFAHFGSIHTYDPFTGLPPDVNNTEVSVNAPGWDATYTYHITDLVGIAGDFSGSYGSGTVSEGVTGANGVGILQPVKYHMKIYSYTFGPVFYFSSNGNVKPFVHALIGGATGTGSACSSGVPCTSVGSATGLVAMIGGGADLKYKPSMSIRIFQGDWIHTSFASYGGGSNVRISAGVVFHF